MVTVRQFQENGTHIHKSISINKHTTIIDNNVLLEHKQMRKLFFFPLNKLSIKLLTGTREVN